MKKLDTALIVRTTGSEARANAEALALTMKHAGLHPSILPYWPDDDDSEPADAPWHVAPLLASEIRDAPRLSAFAFQTIYGYLHDLPRSMSHSYAVGEIRPDTLLPESPWAQHLRGVAHLFARRLAELAPTFVLVPNGAEVISVIMATTATKSKCKVLFWESPFFPGFHFIDPHAPHFYPGECRIDRLWQNYNPMPDNIKRARSFALETIAERRSKYEQNSDSRELDKLREWVSTDTRPIVFIPYQVPTDANVGANLGGCADLEESLQTAINSIPSSWRLITKQHPKGRVRRPIARGRLDQYEADSIALHEIFCYSAAVATLSSNVGLEAILFGIPVAVWGRPIYSGKGVTVDLNAPATLGRALAQGLAPIDAESRNRLVAQLLDNELIRHGDSEALLAVLSEAAGTQLRSFADHYPMRVRKIVAAVGELLVELKQDSRLAAAIERLRPEQQTLITTLAGPSLHEHTYGGPVCPPDDRLVWPDLELFAAQVVPEPCVQFCGDLQNDHDPGQRLRELTTLVTLARSIVFELKIHRASEPHVQNLTSEDIVTWLAAHAADITPIVWGRDDRYLSSSPGTTRHVIIMLRKNTRTARLDPNMPSTFLAYRPTLINPSLFSGEFGRANTRDEITIEGPTSQRHVIFGPYRHLPTGRWRATVLLQPARQIQSHTRWTIDVLEGESTLAASEWESNGLNSPPSLDFEFEGRGLLEIRVWSHNLVAGEMFIFRGVQLHDTLRPSAPAAKQSMSWLRGLLSKF